MLTPNSQFTPTPVPADNFIDKLVVEKLNRLKITPSPTAGDEEFLRRVYLDLIGVQPQARRGACLPCRQRPEEARARSIDALFDRPEFVDHWSLKWGDLLQNSRNSVSSPVGLSFPRVHSRCRCVEHAARRIRPADPDRQRRRRRRPGQRLLRHQQGHQRHASSASRRFSAACACSVPAAIRIRWRTGRRPTTTAWPASSTR